MILDSSLADIDPNKIKDLPGAKSVIFKLLDAFALLTEECGKLFKKIEELEDEIRRLKNLPPRPKFKNNSKDYAATKHVETDSDNKPWSKSSKTIEIDREVTLLTPSTCECGSTKLKLIRTWNKTVQGIVIKRDNVCYTGKDYKCLECGKVNQTLLPEGAEAGSEFGSETKSWVSLFKFDFRASEQTIQRFLNSAGLSISAGQINNILSQNSLKLRPGYEYLKCSGIALSPYNQTDATGWRRRLKENGKVINEYLQFVGHGLLSVFAVTRKYNSKTVGKLLGREGRKKPLVSDDHSTYAGKLMMLYKQLCWIHEIRHYEKLEPILKTHQKETALILNELRRFYSLAKAYGHDPTKEKKEEIEALFDMITAITPTYPPLTKQLKLTQKKKDRLLVFLKFPFLPIHNNTSEIAVRHPVLMRKISMGTKSEEGDRSVERHLSIIGTAGKQGLDVFATLHGLLNQTLDPSVLTQKVLEI
jgi:hypothetical protein